VTNLLSGKSCTWGKSSSKAHPDRLHFQKLLFANNLEIKNNPVWNTLNFVSIQ
jgi:hypothetical protein